jgi:hypothetical protein
LTYYILYKATYCFNIWSFYCITPSEWSKWTETCRSIEICNKYMKSAFVGSCYLHLKIEFFRVVAVCQHRVREVLKKHNPCYFSVSHHSQCTAWPWTGRHYDPSNIVKLKLYTWKLWRHVTKVDVESHAFLSWAQGGVKGQLYSTVTLKLLDHKLISYEAPQYITRKHNKF